jgi:hypothetical protein
MKNFVALFLSIFLLNTLSAQEEMENQISYKPIFLIYSNFYKGISKSSPESNFDVRRAYFGYDFFLNNEFAAMIRLDIGSPDERQNYSLTRRNAYVRNAFISYNHNNLKIDFGIIDNFHHKLQEKNWEKRYIYKTFLDEYKFVTGSDLGIKISCKFLKNFILNTSITNGEYLSNIAGFIKYFYSAGLDYIPSKKFNARIVSKYSNRTDNNLSTSIFLYGNIVEKIRLGGESILKIYFKEPIKKYNFGYNIFAIYDINEKINLFIRYDDIKSNLPENYTIPWNLPFDGSALLAGVEYKFNNNVRLSLNYQDWYPFAANLPNKSFIYLNVEFGIFESYKRL